ncbi:MAG: protein-glutamate methylesterase/protein-glutamine glutaminase [Phycisphaerales bacterium]
MPIRVLVVDDSAFMRRALTSIIESDARFELLGTAFNGINAIEKIRSLQPDVITLDVEMPELDGLGALRRIMAECEHPPAVVMCSSLTEEGSRVALEALAHGAADVIAKPTTAIGLHESPDGKLLLAKLASVAPHRRRFRPRATPAKPTSLTAPTQPRTTVRAWRSLARRPVECVVVGSSTGGPPALEQMLGQLPADGRVPVVVAQHMPPMFTKSMAERLAGLCACRVLHAEPGMPLVPGAVIVAQGGKHLRLVRGPTGRVTLDITTQPESEIYRPSVNVLFESAAAVFGGKTLGVMLTGMGDDGLVGSRALIAAGGLLLSQDEASCVVYGMPKAVADAGLVTAQMPPADLGCAIAHLVNTEADPNRTASNQPAA